VKKRHEGKEIRLYSNFLSFGRKDGINPREVTICMSVTVHETRSGLNCHWEELQKL